MFLDKSANKIKGYVVINVCGFFIERFLNLCLVQNISLWDVERSEGDLTACANVYDYKKVVGIAKKTGCKINIIKKVGVPFFLLRHKKRKSFLLFSLLIIGLIYLYSQHVWQIDIIGDFTFSIEDIKSELETENFKVGVLKDKLDIDKIKNNIYMRRHDIAWIGINFKGTKATVEIVEGNLKEKDELDGKPCNILANKDGVIYELNVLAGTAIVDVGEVISSGDVLIVGQINYGMPQQKNVVPKGTIFAKTWYTDKLKIPYETDIISKTGKEENKYILGLENYEINLSKTSTKFEKYDRIIKENSLNLFGKFDLPISLKTITYSELDVETIRYTSQQAKFRAETELKNKMLKELKDVYKIIDTKIDTYETVDGVVSSITVECIEEIGTKQKMEGY